MAKIFITVAGLIAFITLAGCNAGGPIFSSATAICGAGLDPFASVCDDSEFDDDRLAHCLMNGNAVTLEGCRTRVTPTNPCVLEPFAASCDTDESFEEHLVLARIQRFQYCSFGSFNPEAAACVGYTACTGTNANPFGENCTYSGFSTQRATRISFCTAGVLSASDTGGPSNPSHNNCTGQNVGDSMISIADCIGTNPFDSACTDDDFGNAFSTARRAFVDACNIASPDAMNCGQMVGTQTITNCITDPFHADCTDVAFNGVRVDRIRACGATGNSSGVDCTVLNGRATAAVLPRLDLVPGTLTPGNQFLQGTEHNGDDLVGLDVGTAITASGNPPTVISLNLATASFQRTAEEGEDRPARTSLGGDASDGVAFFFGTVSGRSSAYAGILAGTDLGARITQTSDSAQWHGQFQTIEDSPVNTDFTLDIDFKSGGGDINAFVQAQPDRPLHYRIDGTFNANGLITGTVTRGDFPNNEVGATPLPNENLRPGLLQGLIGQEGAVGAFIRNDTNSPLPETARFNYAGGFVACPLHADGQCENAERDPEPPTESP